MTNRSVKITIEAEDQASPLVDKAADRMTAALERTANKIKQSVLTPTQRYQQELRELHMVLDRGKITQREYNLALDQTKAKYAAMSTTMKTRTAQMQSSLQFFSSMRMGILGVGAAAAGVYIPVKRSLDELDRVAKTSSKLGFNPGELQMARFAGEQTGVGSSTMDMALQRFVRRTAEAAGGKGEAVGALKELNLEAATLMRMPLREQLTTLADAFARVPEEADRVRLAMKLFDSEGVSMVNTLQNGSQALDELFKKREAMGGLLSEQEAANIEKAADAWNAAATQIKSSFQGMITDMAPILTSAAEVIAKAARGASGNAEGGFGVQQAVYDTTLRGETNSLTRGERGTPKVDRNAALATQLEQLREQDAAYRQQIQDIRSDSTPFVRMFNDERVASVQADREENNRRQREIKAQLEGKSGLTEAQAAERVGFDRKSIAYLQGQTGGDENLRRASLESLEQRVANLTREFPSLQTPEERARFAMQQSMAENRSARPRPPQLGDIVGQMARADVIAGFAPGGAAGGIAGLNLPGIGMDFARGAAGGGSDAPFALSGLGRFGASAMLGGAGEGLMRGVFGPAGDDGAEAMRPSEARRRETPGLRAVESRLLVGGRFDREAEAKAEERKRGEDLLKETKSVREAVMPLKELITRMIEVYEETPIVRTEGAT